MGVRRYRMVDVTPPECQASARDISSAGSLLIANREGWPGDLRGLLWDGTSSYQLVSENGTDFDVRAMNDDGMIVGRAEIGESSYACRWINGNLELLVSLDVPNEDRGSCADDVNRHGVIVGFHTRKHMTRCVLWFEDMDRYSEFYPDFVPFERAGFMRACAVNDRSVIVGEVGFDAFIKEQDTYRRLRAPENGGLVPHSINNNNVVVGGATEPGESYPFRYSSKLESLGTLAGSSGYAQDINDAGMIVGGSSFEAGSDDFHGFLWHEGRMHDLNLLVENLGKYTITEAPAINNAGQIAATALLDGTNRALLLNPVE
jgi:probable HAF family extracellular repeat protein